MSVRRAALVVALLALPWLGFVLGHPGTYGDLREHYTDHLRQMGSGRALAAFGFDVYRRPYGALMAALPAGPCEMHRGLFDERTAPYPPLAIAVHGPFAWLEGRGVPSRWAHRGPVVLWTVAALLAIAAWLGSLRKDDALGFALLAGAGAPLLLGAGANGFQDPGYFAAAVLGAACLLRGKAGWAAVAFAVSAALSFRAVAFAPLGWLALREAWRLRGRWAVVAVVVGLVGPALAAAVAVGSSLETIPADNPVHVSHRALAAATLGVSAVAAGLCWWWRARWVASVVLSAAVVVVLERSYGWWHALVLLAPAVAVLASAERVRRWWVVAAGWLVVVMALAYREPLTPFWSWVGE